MHWKFDILHSSPKARPSSILITMLFLGIFSALAQVMLMREMLVVFLGNEVSIGTILASWFTGISLGAFCTRFLLRFIRAKSVAWILAGLFVALALALPFQVWAIRSIRTVLEVPAGQYSSFMGILLGSFLVLLPSGLCIGFCFPLSCYYLAALRTGEQEGTQVSHIYTWEAIGSALGGAGLSFLYLPFLSVVQIIVLACCVGLLAASIVMPRVLPGRLLAGLAAGVLALAVLAPSVLAPLEARIADARWRSLGVMGRVVNARDTIYQNLAVAEMDGQYMLYANGEITFVLEDEIAYQNQIHFIMAQKPFASRILLLGGNPIGEVPELLKYPRVTELVCVDLDPGVGEMIRQVVPEKYHAVMSDSRVRPVYQDAPRFIRHCKETFDVVLVNAPDPNTLAANRFHTREFFLGIKRILARDGFMFTSIHSSARLQSEALDLAASVHRSISEVFPVVLVTAGSDTRFFAGNGEGLTFDRVELERRSKSANIKASYFDPRIFAGLDEIAPEKVRKTLAKFRAADVEANTSLRPTTFFYRLMLWSRFSESRIEPFFAAVRRLRAHRVAAALIAIGLLAGFVGLLIFMFSSGTHQPGQRWSRFMVGSVIGTTGFCGMALEMLLVFLFQGLYGYVYARMGIIMAMFMLGLVLGAPSGRRLVQRHGGRHTRIALAGVEGLLLLFAVALPWVTTRITQPDVSAGSLAIFEVLLYLAVSAVGWAVGAEFPMANALYCKAGGSVGTAAAITDASDHSGAAVGSLAVGVVLIPVLGVGATCAVVAALKTVGLLMLLSSALAVRKRVVAGG